MSAMAWAMGATAVYPEWQYDHVHLTFLTIFEDDVYQIVINTYEVELRCCHYQDTAPLSDWCKTITTLKFDGTRNGLEQAVADLKTRLPELTVLGVL